MTKNQKIELVSNLTDSFKASQAMIVCDYRGLRVRNLEKLRNLLKDQGINIQVIKNTLASIAMKQANYPELSLKDTNIFIWGEDQITLSKIAHKFAEENKDNFSIKTGYFDGQIVDTKHIEAVAKLPSKNELIGMLLSVWTAPARYFVIGLDNLKKQKEEN